MLDRPVSGRAALRGCLHREVLNPHGDVHLPETQDLYAQSRQWQRPTGEGEKVPEMQNLQWELPQELA